MKLSSMWQFSQNYFLVFDIFHWILLQETYTKIKFYEHLTFCDYKIHKIVYTAQNMKFSIKDLLTFIEKILNGKLHFQCSASERVHTYAVAKNTKGFYNGVSKTDWATGWRVIIITSKVPFELYFFLSNYLQSFKNKET